MKYWIVLLLFGFAACNNPDAVSDEANDSTKNEILPPKVDNTDTEYYDTLNSLSDSSKTSGSFSNERFKDVQIKNIGKDNYRVSGKVQAFEASYSWVVEDGHNELANGYGMASEGAPAFGNFSFDVNVKKQRQNSTLILFLFINSAKDGSRQYQLAVPLNKSL